MLHSYQISYLFTKIEMTELHNIHDMKVEQREIASSNSNSAHHTCRAGQKQTMKVRGDIMTVTLHH